MSPSYKPLLPRHGVLLYYLQTGIYLIGKSAVGKSETALELLDSGAQLVCDDAPLFHIENQRIFGCCPEQYSGLMHIRELGLLDIPLMKGSEYITERCFLDMIIELVRPPDAEFQTAVITPAYKYWYHESIPTPGITLSCGRSRNISLLVKTAIMQYALKKT